MARVKKLNGISSFVWFTECVTSKAGVRGSRMGKAEITYTAPPPDVKAHGLCVVLWIPYVELGLLN